MRSMSDTIVITTNVAQQRESFPRLTFLQLPVTHRITLRRMHTQQVLLQTQPAANPIYSGPLDAASKVIKAEGFGGLYKGVSSPLMVGWCTLNQFLPITLKRRVSTLEPIK
jgi:hypothetical protein